MSFRFAGIADNKERHHGSRQRERFHYWVACMLKKLVLRRQIRQKIANIYQGKIITYVNKYICAYSRLSVCLFVRSFYPEWLVEIFCSHEVKVSSNLKSRRAQIFGRVVLKLT